MKAAELNEVANEADILGRMEFSKRLTDAINFDFHIQDESYVLLLTGSYGSGKTTFLRMWQKYLVVQGYKVACINAWVTGFEESPTVPILYELSRLIPESNFKESVKLVLPYLSIAGSIITNILTGIDPISSAEQLDELKSKLDDVSTKIFEGFKERYDAINTLRNALEKICAALEGKPLYIFIDELDRLKPSYAIAYLEVIKHFFSVRGVVFVIAADKSQLYSGIEHYLGFYDAPGYLLRFITREACIPDCSLEDVCIFINETLNNNFVGRSICNMPDRAAIVKHFAHIALAFKLTLREMQMIIRCLTQYLLTTEKNKNITINFGGLVAIFFMICLYQKDSEKYTLFGMEKIDVNDAWKHLDSTLSITDKLVRNNIIAIMLLAMKNLNNYEKFDSLPDLDDDVIKMMSQPWDFYGAGFNKKGSRSLIRDIFIKLQGWFSFFEQIPA